MKNIMLAEMQKETWAMEPRSLDALFRQISDFIENTPYAFMGEVPVDTKAQLQVSDGVATVPIKGTLMKTVPKWLSWFGIAATSYADIVANVREAVSRDDVDSIMLHVESPGGMVAGGMEAADVIYEARKSKPVNAKIEDIAASGALWLVSQAQHITANPNAFIGSIGVYSVVVDYSKMAESEGIKVNIIKSGEHKGVGVAGAPITDEQLTMVQELVDGQADNFVSHIARGRGMKKTEVKKLATGQVWLAPQAVKNGLIDEVTNGTVTQPRASVGDVDGDKATHTTGVTDMSENTDSTVVADAEKIRKEATATGSQTEMSRFSALKAAFPDDLDFAAEQFESGANVEQAKAAYSDVLKTRNTELEKKNVELEGKAEAAATTEKVEGAPPAPHNDNDSDEGTLGYMETAAAMAEEKGIPLSKAYSLVSRQDPELFAAYKAGLTPR